MKLTYNIKRRLGFCRFRRKCFKEKKGRRTREMHPGKRGASLRNFAWKKRGRKPRQTAGWTVSFFNKNARIPSLNEGLLAPKSTTLSSLQYYARSRSYHKHRRRATIGKYLTKEERKGGCDRRFYNHLLLGLPNRTVGLLLRLYSAATVKAYQTESFLK